MQMRKCLPLGMAKRSLLNRFSRLSSYSFYKRGVVGNDYYLIDHHWPDFEESEE